MALEQGKKDKIVAALAALDHNDNSHWTDDGLPRTDVVQRLTADNTIRRPEITEAQPGFVRQTPGSGEGVDGGTALENDGGTVLENDGGTKASDNDMPVSDRRSMLRRAVADAEYAYLANEKVLQESHANRARLRAELDGARKRLAAAFPVITAEQNIKQHLRSEHLKRLAAAGALPTPRSADDVPVLSNADAALRYRPRGNSRGGSPVRAVLGPDGKMHVPVNRKALPSAGVPSVGLGAVPQKAAV